MINANFCYACLRHENGGGLCFVRVGEKSPISVNPNDLEGIFLCSEPLDMLSSDGYVPNTDIPRLEEKFRGTYLPIIPF